jgi:streptogramin lyase
MTFRYILLSALATIAVTAVVLVVVLPGGRSPDEPSRSRLVPTNVGSPIDVGINPVAVAVGAGAIWVIDAARQTLTKIDPHTRAVVGEPRHVSGGPFAVAVGARAVWVAAGDGTVRAYDTNTLRPTGPTATVPGANGLAVGGGDVWISSRRAGTVTRIDPRTRRADRPIRVGRGPADIAIGLGAVWVANADGGSVSRIDPRRRRADAPIAVGARQVLAITVGDGSVWVARATGPNADRTQLVQIDPQTHEVVGDPIPVLGAVPLDLVAGNGVWVTNSGGALPRKPGRRGSVDPRGLRDAKGHQPTAERRPPAVRDRPRRRRPLGHQRGRRHAHSDHCRRATLSATSAGVEGWRRAPSPRSTGMPSDVAPLRGAIGSAAVGSG